MVIMKKIFIVLTILIALFFIAGQFMPTEIRIERSTVIGASRLAVFETISNLENFNKFSPWHEIDPNTQYEYSPNPTGVGASMKWFSEHKDVGSGEQRIAKVIGAKRIDMELEFDNWDGVSNSWYELQDVPTGTQVTWGYAADVTEPYFLRYIAPMIKGQLEETYENGLNKLKLVHENNSGGMSPPSITPVATPELSHEIVTAQTIVYARGSSSFESDDIAQNLGMTYQKLIAFINTNGLTMAGMPMALDTSDSTPPTRYVFEAAIPIAADTSALLGSDTVGIKETYAGPVVKAIHIGPYTQLPSAYEAINAFMGENQLSAAGPRWEHYISDPGDTSEDELITHVYMPVK